MAKNTQLTNLSVDTEGNAFSALMDAGFIDIYDGEQPANGDSPIKNQKLLVSLAFSTPAFAASLAGSITANAITSGIAVASGTANWARIYRSDHRTSVMDVSVGTKAANIILPTTAIAAGITVSCSSFTHTIAKATPGS